MKKWIALLLTLVLSLSCLTALAAEKGEPFRTEEGYTLQITRLGMQKTGSDCISETLYQLDVAFPGQSDFSQTVYFSREGWYGYEGWNTANEDLSGMVRLEDVNFDGYPDLVITYFTGATNASFSFFLWDNEAQQFTADNGIWVWLSNYTLYPEKQIVYNHLHNSAVENMEQVLRWEKDEEGKPQLKLIREVEIAGDVDNPDVYYLIEREPDTEYGNTKETYRQAYSAQEIMNSAAAYDAETERLWRGL